MTDTKPTAEIDTRFSSPGATAPSWERMLDRLAAAEIFWISTVRPDGSPHVTPLLAVWRDGAAYFTTGEGERKAKNLLANQTCVLTAGRDRLDDGLDVVVEGTAAVVLDEAELRGVADAFETKYGPHFTSPEGTWFGLGDAVRAGAVLAYRVAPSAVFGFDRGKEFSQTRWTF